ncbi:hypothetical protein RN001_000553 [Aquatica leii]|uniref:Uncharacterized protein n=1 Tax=Aquatica leii TaxID=1421715 RepID=A0AAN7SJ70_9COLE|nr:hypothetical protein RN001_000553 [Aquatica leii]
MAFKENISNSKPEDNRREGLNLDAKTTKRTTAFQHNVQENDRLHQIQQQHKVQQRFTFSINGATHLVELL